MKFIQRIIQDMVNTAISNRKESIREELIREIIDSKELKDAAEKILLDIVEHTSQSISWEIVHESPTAEAFKKIKYNEILRSVLYKIEAVMLECADNILDKKKISDDFIRDIVIKINETQVKK